MERMDEVVGRRGKGIQQKLRDDQIRAQMTWGMVPDTDMIKAAMHHIRVVPAYGTTITEVNELDPGLSGATVGEGRGWLDPERSYAPLAIHGRVMR